MSIGKNLANCLLFSDIAAIFGRFDVVMPEPGSLALLAAGGVVVPRRKPLSHR